MTRWFKDYNEFTPGIRGDLRDGGGGSGGCADPAAQGAVLLVAHIACAQICYETAYKWTDFTGGGTACRACRVRCWESALAFHVFVIAVVLAGVG